MFDIWHLLAIVIVFLLGVIFGRWTVKRYYEGKYEDLKNQLEERDGEWVARNHF